MTQLSRVLIMAGGTGGHIFPGLALAKRLQADNIHVDWLGTKIGLEAKLVEPAGIPIHFINITGIRGKGLKAILLAPLRLTVAVWQSLRIIRKLRPDIVIGLGGFVSGPGGIASGILRVPLVIHEQNAKPGTTNKWLAYVAKKILEGFPGTFSKKKKAVTTGNPVREEIVCLEAPMQRFKQRELPMRLLVLGGSGGALVLNQIVPKAIAQLPVALRPIVHHQSGEKQFEATVAAYQAAGVEGEVMPFIKEMDKAYGWADVVICRAGALTIAELCAAGLGAILIPYPYATDDHQTANAQFMVNKKAAILMPQQELSEEKLAVLLQQLIELPDTYRQMAEAAYELRHDNAVEKVLTICKEIVT